jgi:hypothetical protein
MAMGRPKAALVLRPEQRDQLEGMAGSRSLINTTFPFERIASVHAGSERDQIDRK